MSRAIFGGEIGKREARLNPAQFHAVRIDALVTAGARTLECDGHARIALNGHEAQLDVTEERHACWSPVLERVGEHIDVHERAPVLAGADLAQLAVGMTQAKGGLALIHAHTEELPLERRLQIAEIGAERGANTET